MLKVILVSKGGNEVVEWCIGLKEKLEDTLKIPNCEGADKLKLHSNNDFKERLPKGK